MRFGLKTRGLSRLEYTFVAVLGLFGGIYIWKPVFLKAIKDAEEERKRQEALKLASAESTVSNSQMSETSKWKELFDKKNRYIFVIGLVVGTGVFYFQSLRPYLSQRKERKLEEQGLEIFRKRYPELAQARDLKLKEASQFNSKGQ